MAYIISELDELEREEFYRLKKVQDKKKKIKKQKEEAAVRNKYETDLYTCLLYIVARPRGKLQDLMMKMKEEIFSMKNMMKIFCFKNGNVD